MKHRFVLAVGGIVAAWVGWIGSFEVTAQPTAAPPNEWPALPIERYEERLYAAYYHTAPPQTPPAHEYLRQLWQVQSLFALRNWKFPYAAREWMASYPEGAHRQSVILNMAHFYFYHRRYDSAYAYLQKVDADHLAPDELASYFFMKAYTSLRQGDSATALAHFETLAEGTNPYTDLSHLMAGIIRFERGDYDRSLPHFQAIADHPKFRTAVPAYIIQNLWYLRRHDDLIRYADERLREGGIRRPELVRLLLVRSLFIQGRQCNVLMDHLDALPTAYWTPFEYFVAGVCALRLEDPAKALRHLDRAAFSDPLLRQYVEYLKGLAWYAQGHYAKALQAFEVASSLEGDPEVTERALYNAGVAAVKAGEASTAFRRFKEFLRRYPRSEHRRRVIQYLGGLFAGSKDYPQALRHLREMLTAGRAFQQIFQQLSYRYGRQLLEDGRIDEAIRHLHDAVRIGGNDTIRTKAYFLLGEAYFDKGNPGEAIKQWRNFLYVGASKALPYRADAYYHIGYAQLALKNPKGALPYFRTYLQQRGLLRSIENGRPAPPAVDRRSFDAALRLGDIYYTFRDWDRALRFYRYVAESGHPDAPYAWLHIARIHKVQGNVDAQASALQKALETAPEQSSYAQEALYAMGNLHMEQGRFRAAVETFKRFERRFPRSPWLPQVLEKLALAYYNAGDDDKALHVVRRLLKRFPNSESARGAAQLARNIYVDKGQADAYIQLLESTHPTLARHFDKDSLVFESAFSWVRKDDCRRAVQALEDYLRRFPGGAYALKAHHYAGSCALQEGDTDRAVRHFEAIFAAEPNRYSLHAVKWLARLYHARGDCDRAVRYGGILEEIAGDDNLRREGQTIRLECYYQSGKWRQAAALAGRLLGGEFDNPAQRHRIEFFQARSLFEGGDTAEAATLFDRLRQHTDDQWGAWAALELARLRRYQQQLEEAKSVIFDMRRRFSAYPTTLARAYLLLGEILLEQGDTVQARFTYESLMKNAPDESIRQTAQQRYEALLDDE